MTAPEADGWDELRVGVAEVLRPLIHTITANAMFTTKERDDYLLRKTDSILKLIEAARLNRGGDEGEAGVRQDNAQAGEGEAPVMLCNVCNRRVNGGHPSEWCCTCHPYMAPAGARPAPATPEGLREKVVAALRRAWNAGHDKAAFGVGAEADRILAALQPQAQGGE